jgi:hypothetical protein
MRFDVFVDFLLQLHSEIRLLIECFLSGLLLRLEFLDLLLHHPLQGLEVASFLMHLRTFVFKLLLELKCYFVD